MPQPTTPEVSPSEAPLEGADISSQGQVVDPNPHYKDEHQPPPPPASPPSTDPIEQVNPLVVPEGEMGNDNPMTRSAEPTPAPQQYPRQTPAPDVPGPPPVGVQTFIKTGPGTNYMIGDTYVINEDGTTVSIPELHEQQQVAKAHVSNVAANTVAGQEGFAWNSMLQHLDQVNDAKTTLERKGWTVTFAINQDGYIEASATTTSGQTLTGGGNPNAQQQQAPDPIQ